MKLLLVVDYQNDFVDGALGFAGAENLDVKIVNKIQEYLNNGGQVFYTMDTHTADYLNTREGKQLPVPHCIVGTKGWELYGKTGELLKDGVNSYWITKSTFGCSPFDMTSELFKFDEEVESVEFVGLVTNMCVISNVAVFQARFPNAQMIVDPTLCDSFDKTLHQAAIDVMRGMQVKIIE